MQRKFFAIILGLFLGQLLSASLIAKPAGPNVPPPPKPAPKCEKYFKGPDGKIKVEPVPCPGK